MDSGGQGPKLIRPRLAFWNAAALFHSEPWIARAKLTHFRSIAARADVAFAAECHHKAGDCIGLATTHYEFVSDDLHNPRGSGGMVLVVKKGFFDRHACSVRSLFDGRALALDMCMTGSTNVCSTVAGVHITDTPQHSWSQVARAVASSLDVSKRIFIIGDFNFVDETLDSINLAGEPVGKVGQRASEWSRLLPGFTQLIAGLTHWNQAARCMTALDRLYTNLDPSEVLACNIMLRMTGGGSSVDLPHSSPPAQSDHHSIEMCWQRTHDSPQLAQWIFLDPLWTSTAQSVASQLWEDDLLWQDQLILLERIIHSAVDEVRQSRRQVCKDNSRQVLSHCLKALRHLAYGEDDEVRHLCSLAPFLRLGPAAGHPQMRKTLCRTVSQAYAKHLEEITREKEPCHHSVPATSSRSHWYCRMWRAWKNRKMLSVSDVVDASGMICVSREAEIAALTEHWQPVFQNSHDPPSELAWLLAYVPQVDWSFELTEADFLNVIAHAPNSAVGPDCVPYRAYRSIPMITAKVLGSVMRALRERVSLPSTWGELVTVFIPKKTTGPLRPGDFRPLALLNTLGKLLARAVSDKLSHRLHAVLHDKQCGFLPHRVAGNALVLLENSCFELAVEHAESVILGLDFAAAFPSLSRSWLHSVLIASGCRGWVLHFIEEIIATFSSAIDWRNQRSSWIQVCSGLLQGHPLSALLYVLAMDAWTVQQLLTIPGTISSFADDAQTTHTSALDLMRMTDALEVAERFLNLKVKYAKCRLLPIGTQRDSFATALAELCDDEHPFRRMQIVDSMRVLGWWLGTGDDHELDACALALEEHATPCT
eukprot:1956640-Amphidinium_carterae.3